jgi:putative oxidoreductase
LAERLFKDRVRGRARLVTTAIRVVTGAVFISSAVPKITAHQNEIREFVRYGLPHSSTLVYLVATLEAVGGLLLLLGLITRVAAAGLAADMTGAILTAGTHVGGPIHLGLAPTLLAATLYLVWAGPGAFAVDQRWSPAPNDGA